MSRVQILMYHRIGHFPHKMPSHRAQYCHLPRFRAQMGMLKRLGYSYDWRRELGARALAL